jgi:large subunit ribosomal protein L9
MKVILQKPVDKLGNPGDVAEVADGYARNYLIPRGMAVKAEKGALKHADSLKRAHFARLSKEKGEFEAIASRLIAAGPVRIEARAGEEGRLFGSVTAADIAEAVAAQSGIELDRKDVHQVEPVLTVEVIAQD